MCGEHDQNNTGTLPVAWNLALLIKVVIEHKIHIFGVEVGDSSSLCDILLSHRRKQQKIIQNKEITPIQDF